MRNIRKLSKININSENELTEMMPINFDDLASLQSPIFPDPTIAAYYEDQSDRHIFINEEVTAMLMEVSRQIIKYNLIDKEIEPQERKPIYMYIYSYGGDMYACYSLMAIMMASKTPIITVNMGVAMSAGMLLLLAGHERLCLARSKALIHQGANVIEGTASDIRDAYKDYAYSRSQMDEFILEKTKITKRQLKKYVDRDWYISDVQQVDLGIVDKIVDTIYDIV